MNPSSKNAFDWDVALPIIFTVIILLGHYTIHARLFAARKIKVESSHRNSREYQGMTQGSDFRVLKVIRTSQQDNEVIIPNKNHLCNAPFRLVTVGINTAEAKLLEMWDPSWSLNQLCLYLIDHPEISASLITNFIPSHSKLMCNPNIQSGSPAFSDRHLGNAEWKECMNKVYPHANIQDRKVLNYIYCFWKEESRGVYYIQWELCRYIPELFQQVKENQKAD